MIATRMSDTAFKKSLREASLGAELELEGPYGSFVLHENHERSAIILTGGIGITPFRSIVVHAAEVGLPHKIFLFYTNRRPEEAAFLEELRELEGKNKNYRFIPTMTDVERLGASWAGERGRITAEMIHNAVGDISRAIYYIAGPAPMVAELWQMLVSCGVSPDDIRSEDFPGY
jgi:ferredoxin-NADP reductase